MQTSPCATYTLPQPARSLASLTGRTQTKQDFLVGTSSCSEPNKVHLFEFDDESNQLRDVFNFTHPHEVTSLTTSPLYADRFFSTYIDDEGEHGATLWKIPSLADANTLTLPLTPLLTLNTTDTTGPVIDLTSPMGPIPSSIWPSAYDILTGAKGYSSAFLDIMTRRGVFAIVWNKDLDESSASKCLAVQSTHVSLFDLTAPDKCVSQTKAALGAPIRKCVWNPHREGHAFITLNGSSMRCWDVRTMKETSLIMNTHTGDALCIDANPNKPYYVATGGSDGMMNVWDIRQAVAPVLSVHAHQYNTSSVKYNTFHDQLIVTGSADSTATLWSLASVSSAPIGDLEVVSSTDTDKALVTHTDHQDAVAAVEWAPTSAWAYATLSCDGRVAVSQVPPSEKYKILL